MSISAIGVSVSINFLIKNWDGFDSHMAYEIFLFRMLALKMYQKFLIHFPVLTIFLYICRQTFCCVTNISVDG